MKGILLAGGSGTRMLPLTASLNKQLLPVYNKPMVYYPLSTLMLAGAREVLVITSPGDRQLFERLLGDGSKLGISIRYAAQERPGGIAEALIIGADFAADERVALALGDNVFYGAGFADCLDRAGRQQEGATVFACEVEDPERFGVVELDGGGAPVRLVEKPAEPASNLAVTGLYFYDSRAVEIARSLEPSARGELEITDVNQAYLDRGKLRVETLPEDTRWLDTGTHESLLQASTEIMAFEKSRSSLAGSIEETAFRMGLIDRGQFRALAEELKGSDYGRLLLERAVQE
ncbi:MAG: glucose-1-phosphate thymidylyltransferase RfbA [Planctomycetota bacterium]|nr:glucose-1-phosphate thymidylyltransferase RfbA [Planctomycetota bacterium]MEC9350480.1 glucose-1-phosphate thymidylyltransferase RfbA [Planctomycetota bacterium]